MDSKNVSNKNAMVKKTKGRQKIEMRKITDKRSLQVAFSKRRNGVLKKASELAILCGVDVLVIVFSPSQRVFSFGTPSVDSLIGRYLGRAPPPPTDLDLNEPHFTSDERELQAHLGNLGDQFTAEKKREQELNRFMSMAENAFWWATPIDNMNKTQLEMFKTALLALKTHVNFKKEKLLSEGTSNCPRFLAGANSMHYPPLVRNHTVDGSVTHHHQFSNMLQGAHGQARGPDQSTFRFF
ncbi:hypothetical protein Fmac_020448 [Flemingia macrophylla]|uniref:MADS-box domain-containing protein n=1 Tax=Flemingia macrophylla TaxID=520843 RepID=A0ABD1LU88_9FABA